MSEFRMPSLGADMEAGTLVEWLKQPGDEVKRGDIIAVVETQKGAIEIEIFESGVIEDLRVRPGQTVPVGTTLAIVRPAAVPVAAEEETARPRGREAEAAAPKPVEPVPAPSPAPAAAPEAGGEEPRLRISPAARRRATELGVDPTLAGAGGPDGAITVADIERLAASLGAPERKAASPRRGFDAAAMRRAIGAAMARSKREIPHYYLGTTIDMSAALAWLEEENLERPVTGRLLYGVLLLKAVALALRDHSNLNGFWNEGRFVPGGGIHVGWAIALRGGGLIAPAVHDADRKSLDELMAALRDLVRRARTGGLRSSEMSDPTITVTSLGENSVEAVQGVIYPPQVAIVGFGRIGRRPWVDEEGGLVVRPLISASLAADHRASDGHQGGLFLNAIERRLRAPEQLQSPGSSR